MTDHPQEHESLSAFIEKVEDSGEDRKYTRAGDPRMLADLDAYQAQYEARQATERAGGIMMFSARHFFQEGWKANEASRGPVYTQQQLDEAVRAERERILLWVRAQHKFCTDFAELSEDYDSIEKLEAQAEILARCEEFINKDHP